MFERRLKFFLGLLLALTLVLMVRALQIQVIRHDEAVAAAAKNETSTTLTETLRGQILDCRGRTIAADVPCIDACVDYRAIMEPPDAAGLARDRLIARLGKDEFKNLNNTQRRQMLKDETELVKQQIGPMWALLAQVYQQTQTDAEDGRSAADALEDIRRGVEQRMEFENRLAMYRALKHDIKTADDRSKWVQWLLGPEDEDEDPQISLKDQQQPQVILRAIDPEVANFLGKRLETCPGLVLQPSTHRFYPYHEAGCHLLGHIGRIGEAQLRENISEQLDPTRAYLNNDLAGRDGLEGLCEPLLRGARGCIERDRNTKVVLNTQDFVPGQDVHSSIDIELQREIQGMFKHVPINIGDTKPQYELEPMHGSAVVIDVASGEVRALVSAPDFDLDELNEQFTALSSDSIGQPLLNRATMSQFEPGSSVKPLVGLGGITQGIVRVNEGIECTGVLYLEVNGRKVRQIGGRCWVESEYGDKLRKLYPGQFPANRAIAHHPVPLYAPHRGHDGNPDGFLTYSDALERSCNIYFETVADRLGTDRLSAWFDRFGLGRATGIGITEAHGLLPNFAHLPASQRRMITCTAGIGQGRVWVTPLQMANVAATIARDGIWMRPRLVEAGTAKLLAMADWPGVQAAQPDRVDLHLDRAALAAAKLGMANVVNGAAGTGHEAARDDMIVCGKTGTATASRLKVTVPDANGRLLLDVKTGKPVKKFLIPSWPGHNNPGYEWYRTNTIFDPKDPNSDPTQAPIDHAWFIGFAPADKPQIAFCVMLEYGGSGGGSAAPLVAKILDACVAHGYLAPGHGRNDSEVSSAQASARP